MGDLDLAERGIETAIVEKKRKETHRIAPMAKQWRAQLIERQNVNHARRHETCETRKCGT